MSTDAPTPPIAPPPPTAPAGEIPELPPETQSQRWLKYGVNVGLTTLVVIVLAGIVIWACDKDRIPMFGKSISLKARADLTGDASNKLKPQTVQVIQNVQADKDGNGVTLVNLYPRLDKEEATAKGADTYQRVQNVLDEYRRNGKNIKVEEIDPVHEPAKLDAWFATVKRTYGKNIEKYETFVKEFPKTLDEIKKLAEPEAKQLRALVEDINKSSDKLTEDQVASVNRMLSPAYSTVAAFPKLLEQLNDAAKAELDQKIPDYAGAVRIIKNGATPIPGLSLLSRQCGALVTSLEKLKDDAAALPQLKTYAAAAVPRFQALKAKADESLKKTEGLGELKLDDVRKKLSPSEDGQAAPPAIAVMGPEDVRVVDDFSLWKSGAATGLTGRADDKPKLRFAGEQQLTTAILGLSQKKKQKVAFVRAGGQPLTAGGGQNGFGEIADRLRSYNFDVVEKDFGPPTRQQMPNPSDPTDEDLKDAIWVVFSNQPDPRAAMMGMPPPTGVLGDKLKAHLDAGGSAMCLIDMEGENLAPALKDWGIEAKPSAVIVHERIPSGDQPAADFIEQARRDPPIFILNEFGDHPIVKSLNSLDFAGVLLSQVSKAASVPAGVTVSEFIPVPNAPKSWGETDLSFLSGTPDGRPPAQPTFDPKVDAAPPLFVGAAAERQGKGRLVVIGCQYAFRSFMITMPDPQLMKSKTVVSRFPANGELFTNGIFWLAKNEGMMALSPSAMDSARIEPIPAGTLGFLRVGLVLIALPLLAVAAGVGVWFTRRG